MFSSWLLFERRLSFSTRLYGLVPCVLPSFVTRSFVSHRVCEHSTGLATPILRPDFFARQFSVLRCAAVSRLRPFCHLSNYRATIFWLQP